MAADQPAPENIRKVWGDDAVLCTDERHDSPAWHHRDYHEPTPPHSWRVRVVLVRKSLVRELRYLVRGR